MNLTGRIAGLQRDFKTGTPVILLQVNEDIFGIDDLSGRLLDVSIKIHRSKRSKDANAYFHVLVDRIAAASNRSAAWTKNFLLDRYGTLLLYEGRPLEVFFPDILDVSEDPNNHFRVTDETRSIRQENGAEILYRKYYLIRGSHTYDSKEMARLIDGTVEEAKQYGIETLTPEHLKRMYAAWEESHGGAKK